MRISVRGRDHTISLLKEVGVGEVGCLKSSYTSFYGLSRGLKMSHVRSAEVKVLSPLWYYVLRYIVFERGLPSSVTALKISKLPLDNSKVKQLSQGRI